MCLQNHNHVTRLYLQLLLVYFLQRFFNPAFPLIEPTFGMCATKFPDSSERPLDGSYSKRRCNCFSHLRKVRNWENLGNKRRYRCYLYTVQWILWSIRRIHRHTRNTILQGRTLSCSSLNNKRTIASRSTTMTPRYTFLPMVMQSSFKLPPYMRLQRFNTPPCHLSMSTVVYRPVVTRPF